MSRKTAFFFSYPSLSTGQGLDLETLKNTAILCPLNAEVDMINTIGMSKLPGEAIHSLSFDRISEEEGVFKYTTEYLNSLNFSGFPAHDLILKVGAPMMLTMTFDASQKLCNGTRVKILEIRKRVLKVQLLEEKTIVFIPKITLYKKDPAIVYTLKRTQFPLRPAFAFTINKAQGQTLQKLGLYLSSECFSHGQLYVALSRCPNPNKICIFNKPVDGQKHISFTRNVIFPGVYD